MTNEKRSRGKRLTGTIGVGVVISHVALSVACDTEQRGRGCGALAAALNLFAVLFYVMLNVISEQR